MFETDAYGVLGSKLISSKPKNPSDSALPIDHQAIHIEIVYAPQDGEKPNSEQYKALSSLIAELSLKYNISPMGILFHSSVQPCGSQLFVDPKEGDGCKYNEPSDIAYQYPQSTEGYKIASGKGMNAIVAMVRAKGVWKDGPYSDKSDLEVAKYIYNHNYENAAKVLELNNAPAEKVAANRAILVK